MNEANDNELIDAAQELKEALQDIPSRAPCGELAYILNPLDYAWEMACAYIRRHAPPGHRVEALFVGMNPGPWGMAQTGVPFGSPDMVRDFLKLEAPIRSPGRMHPKRPILGLESPRSEVSGTRLWGGVRASFGTPDAFFKRFFVANYCPLLFQNETGANVTPNRIPSALWEEIAPPCGRHLRRLVKALSPRIVIGVGQWATKEIRKAMKSLDHPPDVGTILHPSPSSPAANRGWLEQARRQLDALGIHWPPPTSAPHGVDEQNQE